MKEKKKTPGEQYAESRERAREIMLGTVIAIFVSIPAALFGAYLGFRLALFIAQKYF